MCSGFFMAAAAEHSGGGLVQWFMEWAKVDTGWDLGVVVFGLFAQATFFGRWIVQWIASERRGMSHMPEFFWRLSLSGATMLFLYFVLRGDPIGVLGQTVGWTVYSRNLYLIYRERRRGRPESGTP